MRVGATGAAVVGVAFGMARFAFGLTLPDVRSELGLSDVLLGLIAGGTFAGFLVGVLLAAPLASVAGLRPRPVWNLHDEAARATSPSRIRPPLVPVLIIASSRGP